jgi:nitroreductase
MDALNLLHTRRSVKALEMCSPGPNVDQLNDILTAGARVPDHGMVVPFYFVVFEGDAGKKIGEITAQVFQKNNPDADEDKVQVERERFTRAPCVVAVVYRKRKAKHPLWEQMMSAGVACQNIVLAANAHGFVAQWLTEWMAYDADIRAAIGMDDLDILAGFIHIGTAPDEKAEDRNRPDLEQIVTHWLPDCETKKGDIYNREKFDIPPFGFKW